MHIVEQIESTIDAYRTARSTSTVVWWSDLDPATRGDLAVHLEAQGQRVPQPGEQISLDGLVREIRRVAEAETPRRVGLPQEIAAIVEGCARGSYQKGLLSGQETWSGSSLQGAAKNWSGRYATSRGALVTRIDQRLPPGWMARTALVRLRGEPRQHRELLLTHGLDLYVWGVGAVAAEEVLQ